MGCLMWILGILIVLWWERAVNHVYWNAINSLFYDINSRKNQYSGKKSINGEVALYSRQDCFDIRPTQYRQLPARNIAEKPWKVATHTEEFVSWCITLCIMKYIPCSFVIPLLRLRCHNHITCFSVHLCRLWFYLLFRQFIRPWLLRARRQMIYHLCCLSKQIAVYNTQKKYARCLHFVFQLRADRINP